MSGVAHIWTIIQVIFVYSIIQWDVKISLVIMCLVIYVYVFSFLLLVSNMLYCQITVKMRAQVTFDSIICAHLIVDIGNKCDLTLTLIKIQQKSTSIFK